MTTVVGADVDGVAVSAVSPVSVVEEIGGATVGVVVGREAGDDVAVAPAPGVEGSGMDIVVAAGAQASHPIIVPPPDRCDLTLWGSCGTGIVLGRRLEVHVILAGLGCVTGSPADTTGGATADTAVATSLTTDSPTSTEPGGPPCFEADIVPIFERSCGVGETACHSAEMYHAQPDQGCNGWLSLENRPLGAADPETGEPTGCPDRALYERLTQLSAWSCLIHGTATSGGPFAQHYVAAGQEEASALWHKVQLEGDRCLNAEGGVTLFMPPEVPLPSAERDRITQWIAEGAVRCPTL